MPVDPMSALAFGGNILGGVMAGRSAKKAGKAMSGYYAESAASLRRNREIGNELYSKYQSKYEPLESDIIDMARTEWNPDYAGVLRRATGDYTRARDQTRGEAMRTYNRMGVDPSNPMYMRGINRTQISDALALSTARNMAREAERTRSMSGKFGAMSGAFNMGANIPGAVIGANTSVSSGMANMGSAYGQMAGANAGAAGYFMNQAFNGLKGMNWGKSNPNITVGDMNPGGSDYVPMPQGFTYDTGMVGPVQPNLYNLRVNLNGN